MFNTNEKIPDEFSKVIKDFATDLKVTFPEYIPLINKWWKDVSHYNCIADVELRKQTISKEEDDCVQLLFNFCQKKFPPRFFDILYQNEEIFKEESDYDTEFLPNIHFKNLWQCEITDKTRETIWKYLQLILFSIIGTVDNKDAFGDTAKLFEAINRDDFKSKLEETLTQMQSIFDVSCNLGDGNNDLGDGSKQGTVPSVDEVHDHIAGMLDGKLGQLAKEIAEETASNLNMDMENVTDMKDVFQNLLKNPTKLMGLVKTVGDKLDAKIKSGNIKESELLSEATEMMNKMKNMPGMDNIQSLLSKMGMGNLSGLGGKFNANAMEAQLNKNMKMAKTKERIKAKAEAIAMAKLEKQASAILQEQMKQQQQSSTISEEEIVKIFSAQEKPERTPRGANPNTQSKVDKKKKKKK